MAVNGGPELSLGLVFGEISSIKSCPSPKPNEFVMVVSRDKKGLGRLHGHLLTLCSSSVEINKDPFVCY